MQVGPEDDRVRLGELRVGAWVQGWQIARVATLHPEGRGIVRRVVGTFGDAHPYSRHVLVSGQVRQVGLQQKRKRSNSSAPPDRYNPPPLLLSVNASFNERPGIHLHGIGLRPPDRRALKVKY